MGVERIQETVEDPLTGELLVVSGETSEEVLARAEALLAERYPEVPGTA